MKHRLVTKLFGLSLSAGVAAGVVGGQEPGQMVFPAQGLLIERSPVARVQPAEGVLIDQPPVEVAIPAEAVPAENQPAELVCPAEDIPAGGPPPIACYALPEMPWQYTGYYVGGGCAFKGSPPDPSQGTWGWDYQGIGCLPRNVWLKWCCRYQGGPGAYKTDGPHVPNVLAFPPHGHDSEPHSEH